MSLRPLTLVTIVVFVATEAASGVDVMKAVGDTVSFRPDNFVPPVTSIVWKHRNNGVVVKAIEWDDEDGFNIPHPRFKDITALDEKTGQITITGLKVEHSGEYILEINSKEQEQRFTLTIKDRVPKPVIMTQKIKDVVYLRCEYSETIIWKNSAGQTLKGSPITPTGQSITAEKKGNPDNFYTCTLQNDVSEETSDPVYERDLFKDRVPKPVIMTQKIKDVVYLRCEYSETIIWKNSAGQTLKGSPITPTGQSITAEKKGNPDNFYTCTLRNDVSEETSDPVYERDLFKESNKGCVAAPVIPSVTMIIIIMLFL